MCCVLHGEGVDRAELCERGSAGVGSDKGIVKAGERGRSRQDQSVIVHHGPSSSDSPFLVDLSDAKDQGIWPVLPGTRVSARLLRRGQVGLTRNCAVTSSSQSPKGQMGDEEWGARRERGAIPVSAF